MFNSRDRNFLLNGCYNDSGDFDQFVYIDNLFNYVLKLEDQLAELKKTGREEIADGTVCS
tara:strand:- start:4003 stop:4182 length:180 start_codon:yes stop_codon:yes gene_type:complete